MNNLKIIRKIEITLQIETDRFVIKEIEPVSSKNMLLKDFEVKNV